MQKKLKILIVEDEKIVALDIKNILEKNGFKVTSIADCYEKAIEDVEKNLPDLILMDVILRGYYNGIDIAKKISENHDIPVLYLTALSDDETFFNAALTKPFGYMVKPVKEDKLIRKIKRLV